MTDDDDAMATLTTEMRQLLEALHALGWQPVATLSPDSARHQPTLADAAARVLAQRGKQASLDGVSTQDLSFGPRDTRVRLYRPDDIAAKAPLILYFPGGGWVDGNLDAFAGSAAALARSTGALVAAASYRLAPEHRFPAAHEDAQAAYRWLLSQAAGLGGDPQRIALVGEAAGGNLAVNVAVQARDAGLTQAVALALIHPIVGTDTGSYSYHRNEQSEPLSKAGMRWYLKQAINDKDLEDKRLNLGDFTLRGLPGTTVITADVDPLMFEGKLFAHKLESSNVPTRYVNFEGVTHGFFGHDAVLKEARSAQAVVAEQLVAAFRVATGPRK